MFLGANISFSGGSKKCIERANSVNINCLQTMPSPPIKWATKEFDEQVAINCVNALRNSSVKRILFHGIYLINLARQNKQLFHLGKMSLVTYLDLMYKITTLAQSEEVDFSPIGVVFHPGSVKDIEPDKAVDRVAYGVNWVLENSQGGRLLLETTAGSGNVIGDRLEELAEVYEKVEQKDRVGFVLDTQHMWASGYNWETDLEDIINNIRKTIGIENVYAIHLNNSASDCGSHIDRHANLEEGKISAETIKKILHHPSLKDIPFILETPALKKPDSLVKEIKVLKDLAK